MGVDSTNNNNNITVLDLDPRPYGKYPVLLYVSRPLSRRAAPRQLSSERRKTRPEEKKGKITTAKFEAKKRRRRRREKERNK